jgi:hypothetical protein
VVLFVLLQAEAARVPVDDPLTHLELTMIHEVMVLDHSGPELAAMQYAGAEDDDLCRADGRAAQPLRPVQAGLAPLAAPPRSLAADGCVAVAVGCVESLVARLRMRTGAAYLMPRRSLAGLCAGHRRQHLEPLHAAAADAVPAGRRGAGLLRQGAGGAVRGWPCRPGAGLDRR